MVFKSNAAAFEYACRFLTNDLTKGDPVTAIVLETKSGRDCVVKVANNQDCSIPKETVSELIDKGLIEFICPMAKPLDNVPPLLPGDLVVVADVLGLTAMGKPLFCATVVAKLRPIFDIDAGGWVNCN